MRKGILVLIAALLFISPAAPAADKTIGVVMSGNIGYYHDVHRAFSAALAKEGFDFKKVDTILQMPSPDPMSWTNASRKLVVAEVNVLVTYGAASTLAAMRETKGIPIVYAGVYDPAALTIGGKNVAGISSKVPVTSVLKYLKKLAPAAAKVAVVYNEAEPDSARQAEEIRQLEGQYGYQTVKMPVKKADDVKKLSFAGKADAVFITVSAVANESLADLIALARAAKVPTVSQTGGTADQGVVLNLSPSATEQGEAAARTVARVLRGEGVPASGPDMPRLVELVVNVKEAGALGIRIPLDLISDATRVIK